MKQGIYEQLINTITRQEISALDPDVYNIGTEKLDAEVNYCPRIWRR